MSQTQDTIVAALMEQLIAEGPDGMAQVFTALFNLALRLERERFLAADRAGRTRSSGHRLPWRGRPPRRLARTQRPRRPRRLHPAGAALAAHAYRQPHRAG